VEQKLVLLLEIVMQSEEQNLFPLLKNIFLKVKQNIFTPCFI